MLQVFVCIFVVMGAVYRLYCRNEYDLEHTEDISRKVINQLGKDNLMENINMMMREYNRREPGRPLRLIEIERVSEIFNVESN